MNISLKLTLNLATVLLFAHVANSAPSLQDINEEVAPTKVAGALNADWEEARQIWNGVRTMKKQMSATVKERREAGDSTTPMPGKIDDYGLDNISVPTYVKELYRNLSQQDTENIDATTIIIALYIIYMYISSIHFSTSIIYIIKIIIFFYMSPSMFRAVYLWLHSKGKTGGRGFYNPNAWKIDDYGLDNVSVPTYV